METENLTSIKKKVDQGRALNASEAFELSCLIQEKLDSETNISSAWKDALFILSPFIISVGVFIISVLIIDFNSIATRYLGIIPVIGGLGMIFTLRIHERKALLG